MFLLAFLRGTIYYFCVKNITNLYTENKETITYVSMVGFLWGVTSYYNEYSIV